MNCRPLAFAAFLLPLAAAAQSPDPPLPRVIYGESLPDVVYGPASEPVAPPRILAPPQAAAPTQETTITQGWIPAGPPSWAGPGGPGWMPGPPRPWHQPRPTPGADRGMPQGMPSGRSPAPFGDAPAPGWRR